jgi:hypothetical protein
MSAEDESTKRIKPLIETRLPPQFLYDLGLYLQTCAHIELNACTLICKIEGHKEHSLAFDTRFQELRKEPQKDLIVSLKRSFKVISEPHRSELMGLVDWIKSYSQNRHIAAHGAFWSMPGSTHIQVLYTHKKKVDGKVSYHAEETQLSRDVVRNLIYDADRILRVVFSLGKLIDDGKIKLSAPEASE